MKICFASARLLIGWHGGFWQVAIIARPQSLRELRKNNVLLVHTLLEHFGPSAGLVSLRRRVSALIGLKGV